MINDCDPLLVNNGEGFTLLSEGVVDVWLFSHVQTEPNDTLLAQWLSDEEISRAQQFHSSNHRNQFIVRRAILRHILGRYTAQSPETLQFQIGAYGKLALAVSPFHFNVSHSQEMVAVAVALSTVGIDIEAIQPLTNMALIAHDHFSPDEQATLFQLPPDEQLSAFYRCWTRKEAIIKADGRGIAISLDLFAVTLGATEPARLVTKPDDMADWHLATLTFSSSFMGAVASLKEIEQVCCGWYIV